MHLYTNKFKAIAHNLKDFCIEHHCEVAVAYLHEIGVQIVSICRSPDGNYQIYLVNLSLLFSKLDHSKHIFVTDDFNIHFNNKNAPTLEITNRFCTMNLFGVVDFPAGGKWCVNNLQAPSNIMLLKLSDYDVELVEHEVAHRVTAESIINLSLLKKST